MKRQAAVLLTACITLILTGCGGVNSHSKLKTENEVKLKTKNVVLQQQLEVLQGQLLEKTIEVVVSQNPIIWYQEINENTEIAIRTVLLALFMEMRGKL